MSLLEQASPEGEGALSVQAEVGPEGSEGGNNNRAISQGVSEGYAISLLPQDSGHIP